MRKGSENIKIFATFAGAILFWGCFGFDSIDAGQ